MGQVSGPQTPELTIENGLTFKTQDIDQTRGRKNQRKAAQRQSQIERRAKLQWKESKKPHDGSGLLQAAEQGLSV
jgi:hypothetical protein